MNPTLLTTGGLLAILTNLITDTTGFLDGAKVKLFVNDVDPGKGAVIGDFTLAAFVGSTPIAITAWGEAFLDADGNPNALGPLAQFDYDSGDPETVYGVVLTDAADNLLGYARLIDPKLMDDTNDSLAIVPAIKLSETGFGVFARVA